jgi:hypothetical protein
MVHSITGGYILKYHPEEAEPGKVYEINFTPPFNRVDMYGELGRRLGVVLPLPNTLDTAGDILLTRLLVLDLHILALFRCTGLLRHTG